MLRAGVLMPSTDVCLKTGMGLILPANMTYEEAAAVPNGALTALTYRQKFGKYPERTRKSLSMALLEVIGTYCGTACQVLWGRSYRGMQHHEFRNGEISGSR